MTKHRNWMYGSAAIAAAGAGAFAWELARRRSMHGVRPYAFESETGAAHLSEQDLWRSVSEDIEPTLLDNPEGVAEFQREQAQSAQHTRLE